MIADQNFYDIFFMFFILRLQLRPTAEGQSLAGPKVKIAPTVQNGKYESESTAETI